MANGEQLGMHTTSLARGIGAIVVGVVVGAVVTPFLGLAAGLLAGWAGLAATGVAWVLLVTWPMDAAKTKSHATREDPGRRVARVIALAGSVASLAAVGVVLLQTRDADGVTSSLLAAIAVLSVAASWALIQIDYMLRVAAMYYGDPVGGISFNQDADPMYSDFAYFAVGLGMTYQVADTNVQTNELRRLVIGQTLLAYLFGAIILATVINLVSGLAQ